MMTSFILSIILVFSFVCLPFDTDKIRLRRKLKRWLCVYFIFIMFVAATSLGGAILVLLHDKETNMRPLCINKYCYQGVWDFALIITPFVVLAFHVYFWRRVYLLYDAIDTSKVIIRADVWSSKV